MTCPLHLRPALLAIVLTSAAGCARAAAADAGDTGEIAVAATDVSASDLVVGIGRVEPATGRVVLVGTTEAGRIADVAAAIGDTVREGAPLVRLESAIERARTREAAAALAEARAGVHVAREGWASTLPRAAYARVQRERAAELFARGGVTAQERDATVAESESRDRELARLSAERSAAERTVERTDAAVAVARAQLERRLVRAPRAGVVLAVDVVAGEALGPNGATTLVTLAPVGALEATVEIDELLAHRVRVGQTATVRTADGVAADGRVIRLAPGLRRKSLVRDGGDREDRRVREVRLRLSPSATLLIGARVDAAIRAPR
jgi:multidrug efflux pump subunit AcrA (membrane-fusion protein)